MPRKTSVSSSSSSSSVPPQLSQQSSTSTPPVVSTIATRSRGSLRKGGRRDSNSNNSTDNDQEATTGTSSSSSSVVSATTGRRPATATSSSTTIITTTSGTIVAEGLEDGGATAAAAATSVTANAVGITSRRTRNNNLATTNTNPSNIQNIKNLQVPSTRSSRQSATVITIIDKSGEESDTGENSNSKTEVDELAISLKEKVTTNISTEEATTTVITTRRGRRIVPPKSVSFSSPVPTDSKAKPQPKEQAKQQEKEEEEESSKSESSSEEDSSNIVVIKTVPSKGSEDEGEEGGSITENTSHIETEESVSSQSPDGKSSEEEGTDPVSQDYMYCVLVNPDGSLSLLEDNNDSNNVALVPGSETLNVVLPKNKVKSAENPFPGAILVQERGGRKIKTEGSAYGTSVRSVEGEHSLTSLRSQVVHKDQQQAGMSSVGINSAHAVMGGGAAQLDIDTFTRQLDPQCLAQLDSLIQSSELIETWAEEPGSIGVGQMAPVPTSTSGGEWSQESTAGVVPPSYSTAGGSAVGAMGIASPASVSSAISAASSPSSGKGGKGNRGGGGGRASVSSRASESESNANVRRSLRQQDRIEREEAERIKAENQQMLQREKEMLQQGSPLGPGPLTPQKMTGPTPIPIARKSESNIPYRPAVIIPGASVGTPSSSRGSIDSDDSDRKPYPKRENRRLPAHLADPNYVSLDEEKAVGSPSTDNIQHASRRPSSVFDDSMDEYERPPSTLEISSEEADDDDFTEDDPNKLWCICRQPHNNRFMICCDLCEEWFHGKCVGVTKAQGKTMELKNISWKCPPCKKKEIEKRKNFKAAERASHSSRRQSSSSPQVTTPTQTPPTTPVNSSRAASDGRSSNEDKHRKLSKQAVAQQAEADAAAAAASTAFTPEKLATQRKSPLKRSESRIDKSDDVGAGQGCVVCKKPVRTDSIYCSDQCVQRYATIVGKSNGDKEKEKSSRRAPSPESSSTSSTSLTLSPSKLKRTSSKPEGTEPIFNFHVIAAGTAKSTEIVPPKPKELTASQILKAQREQPPTPQGTSPPGPGTSPAAITPVIARKMSRQESERNAPSKSEEKSSRHRNPSEVESKPSSRTSSRKSDSSRAKEKEKDRMSERDSNASEKLHRENIRKGLRELLKTRMNEMKEDEQRKVREGPYNPDELAVKIEEELCKAYSGANNPKCKAKYRSIFFNLKDTKNKLFQEILLGKIKPKDLVKMESQEMAATELVEWRKKEAEKELEAIKKAELDKIAESKKVSLLEKGIDDAVVKAEELRPLDISDVIDNTSSKDKHRDKEKEQKNKNKDKHHSSEKSKSHGHSSSSSRKESKSHHGKDHKSRDRSDKRNKEHRHERHKSEKDKEKEDSSRDSDKRSSYYPDKDEKVKHADSKNKSKDRQRDSLRKQTDNKDKADSEESSSISDETSNSPIVGAEKLVQLDSPVDTGISSLLPPPLATTVSMTEEKNDSSSLDVRRSSDSEQEQPSSTVKTPDFAEDGSKKESEQNHLFQAKIVMPELGHFHAAVHSVSHHTIDGLYFPESPVPVVGRISPETVWEYINKMKKSKEVIVFRLSPAAPADSEGYMTFFTYFSSRGRLGVMGGMIPPLKDVYLVPLPKQVPIPRCLLPFHGPGLPEERTHSLLCIVTRNIREAHPAPGLKRKASAFVEQPLMSKKRSKIDEKPTSSTSTASAVQLLKGHEEKDKGDDDDAPYTPWEEDESSSSNSNSIGGNGTGSAVQLPQPQVEDPVQKEIAKLQACIDKEKQDIEKITGALSVTMTGIPGLDGEFAEEAKDDAVIELESSYKSEAIGKFTSSTSTSPPKSSFAAVSVTEVVNVEDPRIREKQTFCDIPGLTATPDPLAPSVDAFTGDVDMRALTSNTPSALSQRPDLMDLTSEGSSSKSETSGPAEETVIVVSEDSEEAYSPPDEDSSASQEKKQGQIAEVPEIEAESQLTSKEDEPEVQDGVRTPQAIEDMDDDEPLPPDVDVTEPPTIPTSPQKLTPTANFDDIKISLPKLMTIDKQITGDATPKQGHSGDDVDLDDGFRPMFLGSTTKKIESDVFESQIGKSSTSFKTGGLKFAKTPISGTGPGNASKMKININLSTKQLPAKSPVEESADTIEIIDLDEAPPPTSFPRTPLKVPFHVPPPTQHQVPASVVPAFPIMTPPPAIYPTDSLVRSPGEIHHPPRRLPFVQSFRGTSASSLQSTGPAASVVINLNVPPPPIPSLMQPFGFGHGASASDTPMGLGRPVPFGSNLDTSSSQPPRVAATIPQHASNAGSIVRPQGHMLGDSGPSSRSFGSPTEESSDRFARGFGDNNDRATRGFGFGEDQAQKGPQRGFGGIGEQRPARGLCGSSDHQGDRASRGFGDEREGNRFAPKGLEDKDEKTDRDRDRVQRVNLDDADRGDRRFDKRDFGNRNFKGRGGWRDSRDRGRGNRDSFSRRRFDPVERIRRSRSRNRDRSRSRSRSRSGGRSRSRSRRRRRESKSRSRSRSKSPLSRRWEARNRSRSKSGGRRNRSRPRRDRSRKSSKSPRRSSNNRKRSPSPNKVSPPPSPLLKSGGQEDTSNRKADVRTEGVSDEDWESEGNKSAQLSSQQQQPPKEIV